MNIEPLSFALSQVTYLVASLNTSNYKRVVSDCQILSATFGFEIDRHLFYSLLSYVADFKRIQPVVTAASHFSYADDATASNAAAHQEASNDLLITPNEESCHQKFLCHLFDVYFRREANLTSVVCFALDNVAASAIDVSSRLTCITFLNKFLKIEESPWKQLIVSFSLTNSVFSEIRCSAKQNFFCQLNILLAKPNLEDEISALISCDKGKFLIRQIFILLLQLLRANSTLNSEQTTLFKQTTDTIIEELKKLKRILLQRIKSSDKLKETFWWALPHIESEELVKKTLRLEDNMALSKSMAVDGSVLPELIVEIGYNFTSSYETCLSSMRQLTGSEIHASTIAKVIGVMVRTHSGLDDEHNGPLQNINCNTSTGLWGSVNDGGGSKDGGDVRSWNVEVFIKVVRELQPTLHWKEIIFELDYAGFMVKDRAGLCLLIRAVKLGLMAQGMHGPFPVELFCRHWKNTDAQMSFFQMCLRNPDVFSFADHCFHRASVEALKVPPDMENNRELATWRSLEMVEALLYLAESGHAHAVIDLLQYPKANCPDVLVLSLMQVSQNMTKLRSELIISLLQVFLSTHPNSSVVISYAWSCTTPNLRGIVIHAMAEWYGKAEREGEKESVRLSRILDIVQDLKALSIMLNTQLNVPFVIDLAILASRREYLNIEKWLTDQIREHGEHFVKLCTNFLQRRIPIIMGPGILKEEMVINSNLPLDIFYSFLSCLQKVAANAHSIDPQLRETILVMLQTSQALIMGRNRSIPPSSITSQLPVMRSSINASAGRVLASRHFGHPQDVMPGQFSGGPPMPPPSSAALFNLPGSLGSLVVSGTASPNRSFPSVNELPGYHFGGGGGGHNMFPPPNHMAMTGRHLQMGGVPLPPQNMMMPAANPEPTRQSQVWSNVFPDQMGPISAEAETEANGYFQRIYNHPPHPSMTTEEVVELLKTFKVSSIQREREVYCCMIKSLFEEYKYFPQYPDKELSVTAQLMGGLIDQGLLDMYALGMALRYVLDALRKMSDSNMNFFGISALDRFKSQLRNYPQYCQHISNIPHFKEFPLHLIEWIEYGIKSELPPNKPHGPVVCQMPPPPPTVTVTLTSTTTAIARPKPIKAGSRLSIANTTNIDTLLNANSPASCHDPPSDKIRDKVAFIFNNLTVINMKEKADDLREFLTESWDGWLSQYLVMQRASIEPNFHSVYASFLEALSSEKLHNTVIGETLRNINILLNSDKSIANFSDRSLLKNLGHWLGLITLGQNRPILLIEIDAKPLIIDAYHSGQEELLYVIPFVTKVLEACSKSKVFKPPCPWTMGLLNLLCELHHEHDLKLNLKFEIEVLCKFLSINIDSLHPTNLIKDHKLNKIVSMKNHSGIPPTVTCSAARSDAHFSHAPPPPAVVMVKPDMIEMNAMNQTGLPGFMGILPPGAALASNNTLHSQISCSNMVDKSVPTLLPPPPPPSGMEAITNSTDDYPPVSSPITETVSYEAKLAYVDIDTSNTMSLVPFITVDGRLQMLKDGINLVEFVKLSIEKSTLDGMRPLLDRAVKISLSTCELFVRKDFALDDNETKLRMCIHNMVRYLASSLTMITCRDHMILCMKEYLKKYFASTGKTNSIDLENTVHILANDNADLACSFLQKKAVERVIVEIDKHFYPDFIVRIRAHKEGKRFYDSTVSNFQSERMPEILRMTHLGVTPAQTAVYDYFAQIPGFKPMSDAQLRSLLPHLDEQVLLEQPLPNTTSNNSIGRSVSISQTGLDILDRVSNKIELFVKTGASNLPSIPHIANLRALVELLSMVRTSSDSTACMNNLVIKCVQSLLEGVVSNVSIDSELLIKYRDSFLLVLQALADGSIAGCNWTNKRVTLALAEAREDIKYNLDVVEVLIRTNLVNLYDYDKRLALAMANGENQLATAFAMQLCQIYLIDDRSNAHNMETDLFGTIEVLHKILIHSPRPPEGLSVLMEMLKQSSERLETNLAMTGSTAHMYAGIQQAREYEDPLSFVERTEFLLREWVNAYHSRDAGRDSRDAFAVFAQLLHKHGILNTDELTTRFFRLCMQMCVDLCYRALGERNITHAAVRAKCFHTLDAFIRLMALLIKHSGEQNNTTKINLLNKILGIVAGVLVLDHEVRTVEFHQVPYHRIFIMLFLELTGPDALLESINFDVLCAYCNVFHYVRPVKAPGFAYAWLELISHRKFLACILAQDPDNKGWPMFAQLLVDLFRFLLPFLRNAELSKPVNRMYQGTLRVLLVLLHDFPEFLCDYHYTLCDVIPPNCIQMRNLILSAFPQNMRLPDPFTPNLKPELLQEIGYAPRGMSNYTIILRPSFKKDLNSYLKDRSPVAFLSEVRGELQTNPSESAGNRYNVQMMNALIMHVGTLAIQYIRTKGQSPNMSTIAHSSHMDIFQNLAVDLDTEGRYLFLNCIANQLRYPNSHTNYFSCTLLYLFVEANQECIQEQITRVLLERLIVNRPHPWGLLISFIELIKNPNFKFWNHEFVHCAPEIQKLFESVARSCMVPTLPRQEPDDRSDK